MKASWVTSSTSVAVADETRQQPRELPLVLADQQLERLLVAALRTLDQLLIDLAIAHGSRP